jgi:regulator of sigma D
MGLFSNKNKVALPPQEISHQDVVDYLTALSRQEYDKIIKAINIYRKADKEVAKIYPLETVQTITMADDFLSDKDTAAGNFLDDEPEPKPKKATKPLKKVKGEN